MGVGSVRSTTGWTRDGGPDDRELPLGSPLAPDARVSRHRHRTPPRGISQGMADIEPPMNEPDRTELLPDDAYDAELLANARPADGTNPQPAPATTSSSSVAAPPGWSRGRRRRPRRQVALVEKNLLGGDCLTVGAYLQGAPARRAVLRRPPPRPRFPGTPGTAEADFAAAMERMRRLRAYVSHHDSAQRFRSLGVDVFWVSRVRRSPHGRGRRRHAQVQEGGRRHGRPSARPPSRASKKPAI